MKHYNIIYPLVINILCMTDFVTIINSYWVINDPQSSDMHHIDKTSALPLASAGFSKLWIPFLSYLLDGDSAYVKISLITIYSLFLVFSNDFINTLILPASQLETQLTHRLIIFNTKWQCLIFTNIWLKISPQREVLIPFNSLLFIDKYVAAYFWATLYTTSLFIVLFTIK